MADNINVTGLGAIGVRTDEDGSSKHYQLIKLAFGPDGTFTWVSEGDAFPAIPILNTSATYAVKAVTATTATALVASPLTGRRKLTLQNVSDTIMYCGFDASVTNTSFGFLLLPNQFWAEYIGTSIVVYGYHAGTGSKNVATAQYK